MQVEVGQIVNTHGIKGEVKVKSNLILRIPVSNQVKY